MQDSKCDIKFDDRSVINQTKWSSDGDVINSDPQSYSTKVSINCPKWWCLDWSELECSSRNTHISDTSMDPWYLRMFVVTDHKSCVNTWASKIKSLSTRLLIVFISSVWVIFNLLYLVMPLVINGVMVDKLPCDTISLFEMYPSVKVWRGFDFLFLLIVAYHFDW